MAERTAVQEIAEEMSLGGALLRRWLGCWIDLLALVGLVFGLAAGLVTIPQFAEMEGAYAVALLAIVVLSYFVLTEGLWGRTLGKLLTGLKIVDKNGRMPGIGRAMLRTLLRLFEVNPLLLGGVPAGIAVMCTKRKQRLGDLVADTYVIDVTSLREKLDVDATLAAMRSAPPS